MKFEYKKVVTNPIAPMKDNWLEKMGEDRWELVSVVKAVGEDGEEREYYFKREKFT